MKFAPCADCGDLRQVGRRNLPEGEMRCQSCRRKRSARLALCAECGAEFKRANRARRFCSQACSSRHQWKSIRVSTPDDPHYRRAMRERSAPGLSQAKRKRLLAQWRRQARTCIYCGELATTIDHVLPLVRGGTNHEGNLAPCCKRCNSSKSGWTVVEWRSGLRLPPMREPLPWTFVAPSRALPKPPKPAKPTRPCCICGALTTNSFTCTEGCRKERHRRAMRDKYRARVGIPVDPNEPARAWKAALDVAC
jgi:hypothetical protein